jgi:hypothetical protein
VLRAAKNLEKVHVVTPGGMNLLDMLKLPRMVITTDAVALLTKTLTIGLRPIEEAGASESVEEAKPTRTRAPRKAKADSEEEV